MTKVIGRKKEIEILKAALKSNKFVLIALYGRRRIGKTFLIRKVYQNNLVFEFTGIYKASLKEQLYSFCLNLSTVCPTINKPSNWIEAFHQLSQYIDTIKSKKKKVIFLDEFPWMDTRKSGFVPAFENFWNSYASKKDEIVVVICGSAASYMIQKILKSKGGLHNRITHAIKLSPFNLYETKQLLKYNNVDLTNYDIIKVYMAIGGVPFYIEKVEAGKSVAQIIDKLCFQKNAFLRLEFNNVFASLFEQYDNHEKIIRSLAAVRKGLTRNEIQSKSKINTGGTLTKTLEELEESGFIERYTPFKGTKDSIFRISDEYSMFYLKYIEKTKSSNKEIWTIMEQQASYRIWSGFAFESICMKHIEQIKEGLRISGINSTHSSWIEKNATNGAQIDLLIDRTDNVINICEIKFTNTEFTIDKKYAGEIENKKNTFITSTKTKKSVFTTFITTYGITQNKYSTQLVQNELTMNDLFIDD